MTAPPTLGNAPVQPLEVAKVRRRNARLALSVGTVVLVLLSPLAGFWGIMTVMASDAGTSPAIETYIAVNMTLPLAMVGAPIVGWILYACKQYRIAPLVLLVPVLWAILAFALMFTLS